MSEHCSPLRAERDADAELAGALRDEVGEHAVEADRGEHQRDDGEGEDQDGVELTCRVGDADVLAHGQDVGDGKIGIELAEDFLDRQGERFDVAAARELRRWRRHRLP